MSDGQRRRLVIDANVLIRAVLGSRVKETITSHAEDADFFAPEVAFDDAEEHLPAVLTKFNRIAEIEPALAFLNQLRDIVAAVPEDALPRHQSRGSRPDSTRPRRLARPGRRDAAGLPDLDRGQRLLRHRRPYLDHRPHRHLPHATHLRTARRVSHPRPGQRLGD